MRSIDPAELSRALDTPPVPALLDVRLADDHEAERIPGSVSNPVFEVAFVGRLAELLPDRSAPVVVYGSSRNSREAPMAAEKLARAGYADVAVLQGGLASWSGAGHATERGTPLPPAPPVPDGRRALDLGECRLRWTGRNLLNAHTGTIAIRDGFLDFADGGLRGGGIEFDLRSLACDDLAGSDAHDVLIRHLLDHDFLDAGEHPEARLEISSGTPLPDAAPGAPNLAVLGELTLRGVTCPIEFAAVSGLTPEGRAAAQASFAIDRTRWGILYGSGRFFDRLAGHLVNDLIEFEARLVTV